MRALPPPSIRADFALFANCFRLWPEDFLKPRIGSELDTIQGQLMVQLSADEWKKIGELARKS